MIARIREPIFILLLYAAVATALGHVDFHIQPFADQGYANHVPAILAGTEPAPARYRVLAPYIDHRIQLATGLTPRGAWTVFRWASLFASLLAIHFYLSTWFSRLRAVLGALLVAALLPLTMTNGYPFADHFTELCLFTLGCACIARRWDWAFAVVLILNAFNRETSAFLLPLFLLARPVDRRRLIWAGALGLVWLAIYAGLRWRLGLQLYNPWQLRQNIDFVFFSNWGPGWDWYQRHRAWFGFILIAPLIWGVVTAWPWLPRFLRMSSGIVAPLFLITACLFSSIIEARMLTPLVPLLLPAALFVFGRPNDAPSTR